MNTTCLVFDDITILDAVGPLEILGRLPGAAVSTVGLRRGEVRASKNRLGILADHALDEAPPADILLIPGGPGIRRLLEDENVLEWVRRQHDASRWTASVCTGSLLLGAAGILEGKRATTHWNALEDLRAYGAEPVAQRVVASGNLVMGAGVSAGIDMALRLTELVAGEDVARAIALRIEYDPDPPYDCGTPAKASEKVLELAKGGLERM